MIELRQDDAQDPALRGTDGAEPPARALSDRSTELAAACSRALEALDLEQPIVTREGMTVDDLVRAKMHYLVAQDRSLVQQIQLSDAKAATVLTLMGLLTVNSDSVPLGTGPAATLSLLFLALMGGCLACALWAVIPRYPPGSVRDALSARDRYSWPGLASDALEIDDYAEFMRTSQASQMILSVARSNAAVSRILLKKFRALRLSFQFAGAAVFVLGLRAALGL
ncbi:MAG: Pycsar system effector family protein [Pseudomonadota bacterium]